MKSLIPSVLELKLALYTMRAKEKTALLLLLLIFFAGLLGVWIELQKRFAEVVPIAGGTLSEGIVGTPHLINPLLATTDADRDLTMLVYASLLKSDGKGGLEKELANDYEISEDGLSYTFRLKKNLFWHDGNPLTSEDIAFTVNMAKDPSIKSPVRANWEGVDVEVVDEMTIRFTLKRAYAPFLENTTLGILPKHIWALATPDQFGLSEFNRTPVGAGSYKIDNVKRNSSGIITSYELSSYKRYALGKPLIKKIKVLFYNSEEELLSALVSGQIDSAASLSAEAGKKISGSRASLKTLSLPRTFGVFFNQNKSEILRSQEVRQALDMATNKKEIVASVLGGFGTALTGPLPPGIMGYQERPSSFAPNEAASILEKNGWELNEETGFREKTEKNKETQELAVSISTANTSELAGAAELIKNMWQDIGVKTEIRLYELGGLNQNVIRPREYEGLLFGQVVGRDPDPFAFWHSSQRNDPGLNIALYTNKTVDTILESARSVNDIEERRKKYEDFEEEVVSELPAVFLYSPYYLYVLPKGLGGFNTETITVSAERFANVHNWHLYTARVWKIFIN